MDVLDNHDDLLILLVHEVLVGGFMDTKVIKKEDISFYPVDLGPDAGQGVNGNLMSDRKSKYSFKLIELGGLDEDGNEIESRLVLLGTPLSDYLLA